MIRHMAALVVRGHSFFGQRVFPGRFHFCPGIRGRGRGKRDCNGQGSARCAEIRRSLCIRRPHGNAAVSRHRGTARAFRAAATNKRIPSSIARDFSLFRHQRSLAACSARRIVPGSCRNDALQVPRLEKSRATDLWS